MRIYLFLLFLFFPLSGCHSQTPALINSSLPQDPYVWDFGRVKKGAILRHDFIFKNNSAKILNISAVNASCSCTQAKIAKVKLAAKESTSLAVQLDTAGYQGKIWQIVYVNTDDARNPVLRFTLIAEVLE